MSTSDGNAPKTGVEGRVEQLDETFGIVGWAVDHADPEAPVAVELWAGDTLLARAETGLERADVCHSLDIVGRPGFRFDDAAREAIREAAAKGLAGDLTVRPAGAREPLGSLAATRSLELVRLGSVGGAPSNRDALIDRLSHHARAARQTFEQPLRPMPGRAVGFVESIALDDSGITWVIGWMVDEMMFDRPMVIVDSGKHAAGLAYAMVERSDLPPGSKGFVGILHTDWRASPDLPPYFFLADGSGRFLESLTPTPIRSKSEIAPLVRDLLARSEGGFRDLLRELFHSVHSWALLNDPRVKDLLRVDEVAILPGFGAFVKGWALSPSKESDRFVLKAGNRVMVADDRTVSRHTRPDLASIYPNVGLALERAGFVAVFRGDLEGARLDEMILKTTWGDGSATNEGVDAEKIRVLGVTAPIETAAHFYPAIEAESFFPDFARHAAAGARNRSRATKPYQVEPASAAMVLVAPTTSSDVFLMVESALRHARDLPAEWGIAILARSDQLRPLIVSLLGDLKRATGRPCSLFFIADVAAASEALIDILDKLGAERFGYCGPGASLTGEGWRAVAAAGPGLTLLAIDDLAAEDASSVAGFGAFACDSATWRRIAGETPARIGGVAIEALPPDLIPTERPVAGGALALNVRRPSPFIARVNDIDGSYHG